VRDAGGERADAAIGRAVDGLGREVVLPAPPRRIVSLVPSFTEALFAMGLDAAVVAVTRYCVAPAERVASVPKVGGTKNPDLDAILRLRPDLVIASAEENVREHVEALLGAGLTVYISLPHTVRRAIAELRDLARLCGVPAAAEPWLRPAEERLTLLAARPRPRPVRYFCPIWRRPYMVAAPQTYMSDLLRACGGENVFGEGPARYYAVELAEAMARDPDVILLPNEPYPFAARHLPEIQRFAEVSAIRNGRVYLVDGQLLTWYGPRIARALDSFSALLGGTAAIDNTGAEGSP
jgi:ABC-type Fe3+-hydroxamate transport system substrate-binding protein